MKSKLIVAALIAFAMIANGVFAEDAKPAAKATAGTKSEEKKKDSKTCSEGEMLKTNAKALMDALKAKDIEKVMAQYSEKFTSAKLQDKAAVKALFDMASNSGYLDGLEVDDAEAKYTVDGAKATVGPIKVSGSFGTATNTFYLTKEGDKWLITGQDMDGVDI